MAPPDPDSYLICATPRTGSTLLCGLLTSAGVAGRPASYFNRDGLHEYAQSWRIEQRPDGRVDQTYLRAALTAGRTPNGVFGGRVMAGSMPELIRDLRAERAGEPESVAGDAEVLARHLGRLRYVHLRRHDVVGQAVSWARAQQTHFWHPDEVVQPGGVEPHYDQDLIARLVGAIEGFERYWNDWFAAQGVEPFELEYAELAADPTGTARRVLDFLGLRLPAGQELVVGQRRQADDLNAAWAARFRSR